MSSFLQFFSFNVSVLVAWGHWLCIAFVDKWKICRGIFLMKSTLKKEGLKVFQKFLLEKNYRSFSPFMSQGTLSTVRQMRTWEVLEALDLSTGTESLPAMLLRWLINLLKRRWQRWTSLPPKLHLKVAWGVLNVKNRNAQSKEPLLEHDYVTNLQYKKWISYLMKLL